MRKIKYIIFVVLIAVGTSVLYAQPGYQGKKTVVKYYTMASLAILNPTYSSNGIAAGNAPGLFNKFNLTHNISLSRAVSRRSMLGFKVSYCRTSIPYSLSYNGTNVYTQNENEVSDLKSNIYSGGFEYYIFNKKPGNLAPLGSYFMTECNLLWISLYDSKYQQAIGGFNNVNIGAWIGQHKIYYNKIIMDAAVGTQVIFAAPKFQEQNIVDNGADDLKANALSRILQRNLFNLKIGVGYLF